MGKILTHHEIIGHIAEQIESVITYPLIGVFNYFFLRVWLVLLCLIYTIIEQWKFFYGTTWNVVSKSRLIFSHVMDIVTSSLLT